MDARVRREHLLAVEHGDATDLGQRLRMAREVAQEIVGRAEHGGIALARHGAGLRAKEAAVKGLAGPLRGEVRLVQQADAKQHAVGAGKSRAWGFLVHIEVELGEGVAIGAGLAACGRGRDAGHVAGESADAVLVGCGFEGLGGGAEAGEGVEG